MSNFSQNVLTSAVFFLATCPAMADVQVLQIKDSRINSSSQQLTDATGLVGPGVADRLCVVNTVSGRGVRLTFINSNATNSGGTWSLLNAQTGAALPYRQSASFADGSGVKQISGAAGGQFIDIPASQVAGSAATCPANGNVAKWIVLASPMPTSAGEWIHSITLQATSL